MRIYSRDVPDLQNWQPDSNWWKLVLYTVEKMLQKTEVDHLYMQLHKSFQGFRKNKYSHVR